MNAIQDRLLTNVATGYKPTGMICEMLFPTVPVVEYTSKIGKYGKQFLRIVNTVMGGKGKAAQIDTRSYSTDSYSIDEHGLSDIVTKRDYANVQKPFDAERDTVMALQILMFLWKEKALADVLTDTSIITQNTTLAGADQFSDYANSDPLGLVNTAKETIYDACGMVPNKMMMDWKVANRLKYHPQLFERLGFKYVGNNKPLSFQQLADAFEIEQLLVAQNKYNSAKEGQTDTLASVWGKHIILAVAPDQAEVGQVSLGYEFQPVGGEPRKVYKSPISNPPGAKEVIVTDDYDQCLVAADTAAYLIKDAIA